jgi:hypothetical protein
MQSATLFIVILSGFNEVPVIVLLSRVCWAECHYPEGRGAFPKPLTNLLMTRSKRLKELKTLDQTGNGLKKYRKVFTS